MRDVETEGAMYADVDLKKAIDLGILPGPRLWVSTRGLSTLGKYLPDDYSWELALPKGVQMVTGVEECLRAVREQVANGADWIKIYADWRPLSITDDGNISIPLNFTQEEISVIVREAHRLGKKTAVHAVGHEGIKSALDAGADSIEHGDGFTEDLLIQAKKQGAYWCPTLSVYEYFCANKTSTLVCRRLQLDYAALKYARSIGVKVVLGTDIGSMPWNFNQARDFEFLVKKAGFTPMEAIQAGTSVAAQLLGPIQSDRQPETWHAGRPRSGAGRPARRHNEPSASHLCNEGWSGIPERRTTLGAITSLIAGPQRFCSFMFIDALYCHIKGDFSLSMFQMLSKALASAS